MLRNARVRFLCSENPVTIAISINESSPSSRLAEKALTHRALRAGEELSALEWTNVPTLPIADIRHVAATHRPRSTHDGRLTRSRLSIVNVATRYADKPSVISDYKSTPIGARTHCNQTSQFLAR